MNIKRFITIMAIGLAVIIACETEAIVSAFVNGFNTWTLVWIIAYLAIGIVVDIVLYGMFVKEQLKEH